ncbi:glypican-5a isoform X2 [Brachyhypopomus gauderio]|uniref:glypican-5a isoform X2 n=1 Tax=Brachyhypopomus gauderio TaxID=698409 RepID=UPI0040437816
MDVRAVLACLCLAAVADVSSDGVRNCDATREAFGLRRAGPTSLVPASPRTGSDLQVCLSRNLTCCTRKMEERFQIAARRDFQNLLQKSCSGLKLHLSRNVATFQEAVEALVHQAQNHTVALLLSTYGEPGGWASSPVTELFTDVGLFVLGAELRLEEAVQHFFHALFPLVLERLVEPGLAPLDPAYSECVRTAVMGGRGPGVFGPAPSLLASRLAAASLPARLFLQALHLGVEVVNTTEHLPLGRECRRALLRMDLCPLCQALADSRPCTGYCLNVLRGCLASLAEVDAPWREFVRSLEGLGSRPHAGLDLEHTLATTPALIRDTVAHVHASSPWLSKQVRNVCGRPSRDPGHSRMIQQGGGMREPSQPIQIPVTHTDDTLSSRTRELLQGLRMYRAFYGGLADQLCVTELACTDAIACWNGADVVGRDLKRLEMFLTSPGPADPTRQLLGRNVCWLENPKPVPLPLQQSSTRPGHLKSLCQLEQFVGFCLKMASMVESVPRSQH